MRVFSRILNNDNLTMLAGAFDGFGWRIRALKAPFLALILFMLLQFSSRLMRLHTTGFDRFFCVLGMGLGFLMFVVLSYTGYELSERSSLSGVLLAGASFGLILGLYVSFCMAAFSGALLMDLFRHVPLIVFAPLAAFVFLLIPLLLTALLGAVLAFTGYLGRRMGAWVPAVVMAGFLFFGGQSFPALDFTNAMDSGLVSAHAQAAMHGVLGYNWLQEGRPNLAVEEFERVLAMEPDNIEVNYALALAYDGLNQPDKATERYEAVLRLRPNDTLSMDGLGRDYALVGKDAQALQMISRSLELNPGSDAPHSNLGALYAKKGEYDKAVLEFGKAVSLNPKEARNHYLLGMAYSALGRRDEAVDELRKSLELDPSIQGAESKLLELS